MKHLREELGISQQQLADQLKVSRSVIAMAEKDLRPYPEDYVLKIENLIQENNARKKEGKTGNDSSRTYINETIKEMQIIIDHNNYQLYSARFELDRITKRLKKAVALINMRSKTESSKTTEEEKPELADERLTMAMRSAMQNEGKERMKLTLLEHKIRVLEFERDEAQKWVKENMIDPG